MQFSDYAVRLIRKIEKFSSVRRWIVDGRDCLLGHTTGAACLSGEGGTVAVIAMRLMEGQRRSRTPSSLQPDVVLSVVWLFQLTGPNYTALAIFFFSSCHHGHADVPGRPKGQQTGWFAFLTALGPCLFPG
jgi:hypothetical protein